MPSIQCLWIGLLSYWYMLYSMETATQVPCPQHCQDCKYDSGAQLRDTTCVNIQFASLPYNVPDTLQHLTIKDVTTSTLVFGELRGRNLDRKPDLQSLTITNYGIKALDPKCFQNNPKLTTLRLTNNLLLNLSEDNFEGLVNLEYLDLSQNNLTVLSDFVFRQLTALKELKIILNAITSIGENSFKGLVNIEKIDIASNKITSIHKDAFSGLRTLTEISLLSNRVVRLEGGTFSNLINLMSVNLRNNQLVHLDSGSMTGTTALNHLNMAQNSLRTLPNLFLQRTSSLQLVVDLSRNNLTILSDGALTDVNLRTLYLVGNQIKIVQPDAIKNSFIRKLDLQQNELEHFPEAIKLHINQSKVILLANNPWICDCDIYWMASILTNQTQPPVCNQPISYKGWTVSYFSQNVTMSCYSGSMPVPTKAIPVPPKQGIVTPALGTRPTSMPSPTNQTNTTMATDTTKEENSVPIIVGCITGLLFLTLFIALVVFGVKSYIHSKVKQEPMEYCQRADFNSRSKFRKRSIQPLIDE